MLLLCPPKQIGGSLNHLGMVVLYPQESLKGVSVGGSPQGAGPQDCKRHFYPAKVPNLTISLDWNCLFWIRISHLGLV